MPKLYTYHVNVTNPFNSAETLYSGQFTSLQEMHKALNEAGCKISIPSLHLIIYDGDGAKSRPATSSFKNIHIVRYLYGAKDFVPPVNHLADDKVLGETCESKKIKI